MKSERWSLLYSLDVFFPARIQTYQTSNHNRQKKLTSDSFYNRQAARHIRARDDIAVAKRRQRDETKIDRAHARDLSGGGERARSDLLENPIEDAEEISREQIGAKRRIQMLRIYGCGSHSKAQSAARCEHREQRP